MSPEDCVTHTFLWEVATTLLFLYILKFKSKEICQQKTCKERQNNPLMMMMMEEEEEAARNEVVQVKLGR